MSRPIKHQGVISGEFNFEGVEYVEIFDRDYKYLYGIINDLFVPHGSWVEYTIGDVPHNHPINCKFFAKDIKYVDVKSSLAPTSDEFRSHDMNVRDFNKVDYFHYDAGERQLTYKTTITRDARRGNQYFNMYYGDVNVSPEAHRRLIEHRIETLDVMLNFIPSYKWTSGPHWDVIHFINQGKCYSINGYLSITGHVLRGPGGVVRNRSEVTVAPDSLRPRNPISSPVAPMTPIESTIDTTTTFADSTTNSVANSTIQKPSEQKVVEPQFGRSTGFGRSTHGNRATGLARFGNAFF